MKQAISIKIGIVLTIFMVVSCTKKDNSREPELLSSKTWRRSQVLHIPGSSGWNNWSLCSVYNHYQDNHTFTWQDECDASKTLTGDWTWTTAEKELHVNIQGSAILSKKVQIISLSDTLLHTVEIYDNQTGYPGDYWELLYKPVYR